MVPIKSSEAVEFAAELLQTVEAQRRRITQLIDQQIATATCIQEIGALVSAGLDSRHITTITGRDLLKKCVQAIETMKDKPNDPA